MPGLLDFLNSPDSALGIGLLAAAQSGQGFGPGLLSASQYASQVRQQGKKNQWEDEDRALEKRYRDAQIQELQRKGVADARRQALEAEWLGLPMSGASGSSAPAGSAPTGGLLSAPSGAGMRPSAAVPASGGRLAQLSQQYGIPQEALQADFIYNGGKKIAELVSKAAEPNWVNVGGNLVNTRAPGFQGGIQDQVSISNDGRATVLRANGGNPVVGAPAGALDTYAAYQNINNMLGAAYTPGRPVLDASGRPRGQSQLTEIGGGLPPSIGPGAGPAIRPGAPSGYTDGGSRESADAERLRILQEELRKPNLPAADRAAIQRDIARISPTAAASSPAGALDFSPTEKAQQEADRASAVDTAKANVVRDTADQKKQKSAGEMIAATQRARDLLLQGPTSSGIGELADKAAAFVGSSTKGAEIAAKLDIVAGDLVNNVPRMEGPQSDGDRLEYRTQAGRAADRSLPVKIRLAAMDEIERLQRQYAKFNGGLEASNSVATGSWDAPSQQSAPQATMRFNPQTGRLEKIN